MAEALEQAEILTGQRPEMAFVERGCRGNGVENVKVSIGGAKRGVARPVAKLLRRRAAAKPVIGHMKTDGRLTRCPLERADGDAFCGRGHNIRMILGHLRKVSCRLILPPTRLCQINDAEMVAAGPLQIVKAPA